MITVDFNRIEISSGDRILDMGCGSGRHMAETARRPGTLSVGTDISQKDLLEARSRMELLKGMIDIRGTWALGRVDITALPFGDDTFDLVICSEVLEHVPDHEIAVEELVRVLKPGGNLVVSVPRYLPEKICWMLSNAYRSTPGGHIRIYREKELWALITASKVLPRERHWAHSLHVPYWWLKCLLDLKHDHAWLVRLYHRFLTWDLLCRPRITRFLDQLLNPVMGKSIVIYARKLHPTFPPIRKLMYRPPIPIRPERM